MKLYVVRHAQSERNAKKKSGSDSKLSEVGKEQAKRLGSYFHKVNLKKIYCSPLKRAKETLKEIKPYVKKVPIAYTSKMVEHKTGIYEKTRDDWEGFLKGAKKEGVPMHLFKPKHGNSLIETYERAGNFYKEILKKHSNESILLIGHCIFSMHLILNLLGLDLSEAKYYTLNNASISTFEISKSGKVKNFHVNDYNHLIMEAFNK